jgi:hypothetical protein
MKEHERETEREGGGERWGEVGRESEGRGLTEAKVR